MSARYHPRALFDWRLSLTKPKYPIHRDHLVVTRASARNGGQRIPHPLDVKSLMGRRILLSLQGYACSDPTVLPPNHIREGAYLLWDGRRRMYAHSSGLWDAILKLRHVRDGQLVEVNEAYEAIDNVAVLYALTFTVNEEGVSDPAYVEALFAVMDFLRDSQEAKKEEALEKIHLFSMYDSMGRRNPPAARARLVAIGSRLEGRVRDIKKMSVQIDPRLVFLMGIALEVRALLSRIRRVVQTLRDHPFIKTGRATPAEITGLRGQIRPLIQTLDTQVSMLPLRHATAHIAEDFQLIMNATQAPELFQEGESGLTGFLDDRLTAIEVSVDLQLMAGDDFMPWRYFLGSKHLAVNAVPWIRIGEEVERVKRRIDQMAGLHHGVLRSDSLPSMASIVRDLSDVLWRPVTSRRVQEAHALTKAWMAHV